MSAIWFSTLLNLKHIFLYIAPAYVVYLFYAFCIRQSEFYPNDRKRTTKRSFRFKRSEIRSEFDCSRCSNGITFHSFIWSIRSDGKSKIERRTELIRSLIS